MKHDETIQRIWENLEELNDQMTSAAAEGLTPDQLKFVDEGLKGIIHETRRWFTVQSK